ncbi:BrnA antitoxin of type II toxin-antitoxin system [Enhydrobacter aerosaccus]|uniref:BrnA antitoxin of type II toxin-antitoxin system n=1 Tax=Enhydrobacter aerosaccus TaxID=225324 RepID=A0A1T4SGL1_9HYPH|nr:BrnA antitoxin family protein [Enhydrobacter aerosaccus]SKA27303.1 BrnA antitoxin of type II toxin-antitoxin system [Enhydrobacter aerosaccus]
MTANKRSTRRAFVDPDDAPDLSTPKWKAKFDAMPVKRGRPKSERPKISTTLRLDADVVDHFRALGPGWQTRINATLRSAIRKRRERAA